MSEIILSQTDAVSSLNIFMRFVLSFSKLYKFLKRDEIKISFCDALN